MLIVDTSVWVDHLRRNNVRLIDVLQQQHILQHPYVTGELALGQLQNRVQVLGYLDALPLAPLASDAEVRQFIEQQRLYAQGIGYIDAHLLASAMLARARLWTLDRKLFKMADALGLAWPE